MELVSRAVPYSCSRTRDAVFRQCNVASLRCRFAKKLVAVPDGASTLCLWGGAFRGDFDVEIRRIERLRRLCTRTDRRLTPRLILPDLTMVAWRAAAGSYPHPRAMFVVPTHDVIRPCGEARKFDACRRACGNGDVRPGKDRQRSSVMFHAERADAGDSPASPPRSGRAGPSDVTFRAFDGLMVRDQGLPMRPPAPTTTRPISAVLRFSAHRGSPSAVLLSVLPVMKTAVAAFCN